MIFDLSAKPSIAGKILAELRDLHIQRLTACGFRYNLQRIGELLAYEISQNLEYYAKTVETPLE
ncbi:MAG: hypothetical protein R2792_15665 [Saprospiraceae bacterium]